MIIWVTGLSASGKTTLCAALAAAIRARGDPVVVLDGDQIRSAFGNDLGYEEDDRIVQIQRIQHIAKILDGQGFLVIVGALYSNPELLSWNRKHFRGYVEVYLKASMEILERRDLKGLYRKARAGEITDVVGVDIPWHEPQHPDLVIDADSEELPATLAKRVIDSCERLLGALPWTR